MKPTISKTARLGVRMIPAVAFGLVAGPLVAQSAQTSASAAAPGTGLGIDTTSFDRGVRPQDDFFQFANGTWLRETEIPGDRSYFGSFAELRDRSENALREIVDEAAAQRDAPAGSDAQKVGALFRSFMDVERIDELGLHPVEGELEFLRGISDPAELPAKLGTLRSMGIAGPFALFVGQDQKQSDAYITYLSQSGLGLPDRDYYFQEGERFDALRTAYVGYIARLLELAGEPSAEAAAQRVFELEKSLAGKQWSRTQNRDRNATYNKMTLAELSETTPGFDWAAYFGAAGLDGVEHVVVRQPDYLTAAQSALEVTPVSTWREYFTFHLLDEVAPLLSSEFVDAHFDFNGRVVQGLEENRPRWKRGIGVVQSAMGEMVGRMYVERHFQPEAKTRMGELVDNLRQAFRLGIDQLEWMGPETREQAHEKLSKFTVKIGYPDEWEDYSDLEIREGDLLGNMRRSGERQYRRMIERLGQPVDRTEWGMTPQTVNAYYSSSNNEIVFPAAILQPPFFDVNADDAVNYGAIGGVIGHEISHGFDDQGRKSDGDGNLRDWWTAEDAAGFEQRANLLVEQYNGYNPVDDLHVNGRLTLGENIGDLSGLAVAYEAYKLSLNGQEPPVIAGFTGDQRFFLGWAQIWRAKYRDEAMRQQLLTDSHSPPMYRVNGVVVNLPAFYDAFGVQPGDGMYLPEAERVEIW